MNWRLRIKNKATCIALIAAGVPLVYMIMNLLGITPSITQDEIANALFLIIDAMAILGIIVDPTTAGIADSKQAMSYENPKSDR